MIRRAVLGLLLALAPARSTPAAERWELEIRGPATIEHGELQFTGVTGRLLLESNDSVFLPLAHLVRVDSSVSFDLLASHRRFTGRVLGDQMGGTVVDADGPRLIWNAARIPAGANRWPIPPRLTVRQLETGSDRAQVVIPGAWRAALPDTTRLVAEYDSIAKAAGFARWHGEQLQARAEQMQLGLDRTVYESAKRTLVAISSTPAARTGFEQLFRGARGWRVTLHDMAMETALRGDPHFSLDAAMTPIWKLAPGSAPPLDSAAVLGVAWRFWSRYKSDSTMPPRLDSMQVDDPRGVASALLLLRAYDIAAAWWLNAVHWLMTEAWIHTPAGDRSPVQLVAAFWGKDSLRLPSIDVEHFGSPQAVPAPSIQPLLSRLIRPANAIAADWLRQADQHGRAPGGDGRADVMAAWRTLDWGEPFRVVVSGHSRYLTSPAVEARTHGGSLMESGSRILIEPGIAPVLAVATLTHEWQHLILTERRMEGTAPGVRENADEVRLLEEDPWLAEGAAEWATDLILAPCRAQAPVILAISQARRLSIQGRTSDDPHALGYRLVRAAAKHAGNSQRVRDRLTRYLHDLPAFARVSGLSGRGTLPPLTLVRPVNAAVIPEVTFVYDGGAALDVHRRFRVSLPPLEH